MSSSSVTRWRALGATGGTAPPSSPRTGRSASPGAGDGDEPEGHVGRDEIVAFLQDYADLDVAPVREGVAVTSVDRGSTARFRLRTDDGDLDADSVVLCTGAYPRPHVPAAAAELARTTPVLDATAYRDPSDLPEGRILVVGSGQTGVQLAEELHQAGRDVVLACGRAPWVPRRIDGVDIVTWLERAGYFDQPLSALPSPQMRLLANVQATGAGGGHDLHYRVLQERGVTLTGHLLGVIDGTVSFADDLAASVAFGDARLADARRVLHERLGADAPDLPEPAPFVAEPLLKMPVSAIDAVLVTTGFRPDHARWVHFPVFDPYGFPVTADDLTTGFPASSSAGCTSCATAARPWCGAWAMTLVSSPTRSPATRRLPDGWTRLAWLRAIGCTGGMRRRVASAVRIVALIVLAGCSDGDDSADDEPSATETTTLATTAQPSLASQVEDAFSMSYGWPNQPKWQHIKKFSDDNAPRVTVVTDLADAPASQTEAQGYCEAVVSVSGR
ncbi:MULTISPECIES: NAD(P)-binding domain-containing protein [Mumia]|uniref:NAD(P)-binding domain-containing protein n=1 Tax=Mumia TaxID=1546255 RepID=UPI002443BD26|nr:NAD(P)-binding domain-containing protein [Mumia sp. ZJ430]